MITNNIIVEFLCIYFPYTKIARLLYRVLYHIFYKVSTKKIYKLFYLDYDAKRGMPKNPMVKFKHGLGKAYNGRLCQKC